MVFVNAGPIISLLFFLLPLLFSSGCQANDTIADAPSNDKGEVQSQPTNTADAVPVEEIMPSALPAENAPQEAGANSSSRQLPQAAVPGNDPSSAEEPVLDTPAAKAVKKEVVQAPLPQDPNEPPLKLKSLGINLDYYDSSTGMAGDLKFTKSKVMFDIIFAEYGHVIPASSSSSGADKVNPQPTFTAPLGTKVRSLVDGVVVSIPKLYSDDYSIHVAPLGEEGSNWRYETEHVINPVVQVGDSVVAGQVIAEVSPHNKHANSGLGIVEIGILKGGNPPQHLCPFAYLDDSIRQDAHDKILALYSSWEKYRGDSSLYDERSLEVPGCRTLEPVDG